MNSRIQLECSYCKNITNHRVIANHVYKDFDYKVDGYKLDDVINACNHFVACEGCGRTALYYADDFYCRDPYSLEEAICLYPYPGKVKFGNEVPHKIKRLYSEAELVLESSPGACVTLIRKALEFVCRSKGAKEFNLKGQIRELSDQNILPGILPDIADKIRFIGNIGAHDLETDVKVLDAQAILELFRVIVEYVYILPTKIEKIEEIIAKSKEADKK